MNIVIATSIYPPSVGGQATHAKKYAEGFSERGIQTRVLSYGRGREGKKDEVVYFISMRMPYGIRHIAYFFRLLVIARGASVIYALDALGSGLPALLASRILHVPLIVRIGGDVAWERFAENRAADIPLSRYYADGLFRRSLTYRISAFVLRRARKIIVVAPMLRSIYLQYYGIPSSRITIIHNPMPDISHRSGTSGVRRPAKKIILYASRFVGYKNLERLIAAFREVHRHDTATILLLIGEGPFLKRLSETVRLSGLSGAVRIVRPLPQEKLLLFMKKARVCVAPAITEFHPNYIMECLSVGTSIAVSRENGLPLQAGDAELFDPLSVSDMARALLLSLGKKPSRLPPAAAILTWDGVISENLRVIREAHGL
ncbi:MAG: glycosyltransferase family 4 protein [Candidatus Vogelbacteria bacterium]|nr:glycosyltransferase family 4 protein [Candidatus Vogelbacteria bacterium]